jgi:hypothetical protein
MHRIKQEGACLIGANEWLELRMKRKKARDWEGRGSEFECKS